MKSKNATFSLLLVLAVLAVALLKWRQEPERKEAFERSPEGLYYSDNARCRMQCLGVNENDINRIMKKGIINFSRSNRNQLPCPQYALQGRTTGGQYLRVFFLQCPQRTTVLNCYNLEKEPACKCPDED
ncbi:MAG TPA: DUF4258 domain-containing protein [Verrucomicrobiae bacterium]|nr:DUF4258 domain-containing protein [Verrucomicrobiae bacterium]